MVQQRVGAHHLVVVHRPVPIDPNDWAYFLEVAESIARSAGRVHVLVRSEDKGGPDAGQRADLNERFSSLKMRVAVLTASRVTRGIAMALSWLKVVDIKAFPPGKLDPALEFLETDGSERPEVAAAVRELESRLDLSTVA